MKTVVLNQGGTRERVVPLSEIQIIDIRPLALFVPRPDWVSAILNYYPDLVNFLDVLLRGKSLPRQFFVPDLWHPSRVLPKQEREMLLEMWGLGHDLARNAGCRQNPASPLGSKHGDFYRDVQGSIYLPSREE